MGRDSSEHPAWRRRLSRREVLRGASLAIGATTIGWNLVGCGGSTKEPAGTTVTASSPTKAAGTVTVTPRRGGTVTEVLLAAQPDLDPQQGRVTRNFSYDHLLNYDYINGRYELALAESMENPDPLTYIFKLRPNAKHHDLPPVNGRNVDSEDCKASWEAYVANPRAGNKGVFLDFVDHYETPNPSTFIVKLKKPNTWLIGPHGFAGPNPGVIGPKELFDGGIKTTTTCIGPGGFVLEQFDSTKVISFKRRPDPWYPNDGRPYPDRLVWTVITDPAVRAAALKAKQIDRLAARDKLEAEEFKSYGPDMRIRREPGFPSALIVRADSPTGLFADVRVREAIYNALDIQELIDSVALGEGEYSGPVPPFLKAWAIPDEEVRKAYPHDVNKAKQILSSAGWDNTKEVELKYPTYPETSLIAELVQKQLGLAGIRIRLVPQDPLTVWQVQTLTGRDFQMTIAPGSIVYIVDPDFRLRQHTTIGGGGGNYAHWSDPEVDDIVARQATEFDFEKQKKMIQDAQRLVLKKFSPFISLHQPYSYTAYWSYYHPYWTGDDGFVGLLTCRLWTEKP